MQYLHCQNYFPSISINYYGGFNVCTKDFFSIFQYSFLQKVQLNSLPPTGELDIVTHFYSTEYEKEKKNSNFAGEECGMHHLSHMIKVYITSTKSMMTQCIPNMMWWEGYLTFVVDFLKIHNPNLIMKNTNQTQIDGQSTKYLTSDFQKGQRHEKFVKVCETEKGRRRLRGHDN